MGLLQRLILSSDDAGRAFVPYFRQVCCAHYRCSCPKQPMVGKVVGAFALQILPELRVLAACKRPAIGRMSGGQHAGRSIADIVAELLQVMEVQGGPESFRQIKLQIPTAESHCHVA